MLSVYALYKNGEAYDQCESCGVVYATELINPQSTLSGSKPKMRNTKHWYLPLDKFESFINEWIIKSHKSDWKQCLRTS